MLSPWDFLTDLTNPVLAFLPRALVVAVACAVVCAVVGCHVVLRGMAFVGDAVAHAIFPGLAVAFVLQGSLLIGGLIAGLITAVLTAVFAHHGRLRHDSIIGVFFVAAFAVGIVVMAAAPGYTGSLNEMLFGSITGIPMSEVTTVVLSAVGLVITTVVLHPYLVAVSVDRESARAARMPVLLVDIVLYVLVTICVVISVRTIGNILVLALLLTPAATARLLTDRLSTMMIIAATTGGVSAIMGIYVSWSLDTPTGGTIVLVATALFVLAWLGAPRHGLLRPLLRQRRLTPTREQSHQQERQALHHS